VIQIVGGYDKQLDMTPLRSALHSRAKAGLFIGVVGEQMWNSLRDEQAVSGFQIHHCQTLDSAVETARRIVTTGDVVLLSPGCASYDQFSNFQERGGKFVALARGES
jgi:UDP-N-acetylmuramoylalanine--D-glutamate ligase